MANKKTEIEFLIKAGIVSAPPVNRISITQQRISQRETDRDFRDLFVLGFK